MSRIDEPSVDRVSVPPEERTPLVEKLLEFIAQQTGSVRVRPLKHDILEYAKKREGPMPACGTTLTAAAATPSSA